MNCDHGETISLFSGCLRFYFQFILIDGGPGQIYIREDIPHSTTGNLFSLLNDLSYRKERRLESINTIVVTHDDEDHKNGVSEHLRNDSRLTHDETLSGIADLFRFLFVCSRLLITHC
jgi:beta-lactamase superfamily II metal-dependent hydrolase